MDYTKFYAQIKEDLDEYKRQHPFDSNIEKPEWAFNYWILDKLYGVDESVILSSIIDRHDKGIDCYHYDEDDCTLYLFQNKYYTPELSSQVSLDYVKDVSVLPLGLLENNAYTHSPDLQKLYNGCKRKNQNFNIKIIINITKRLTEDEKAKYRVNYIKQFNEKYKGQKALYINDIVDLYKKYYEDYSDGGKKLFNIDLNFTSRVQLMDLKTGEKDIPVPIHAKYILLSVIQLYKMMVQAHDANYNLFDENIRDYLGTSGKINKKIKETLESETDRQYFFYYNNGITIISSHINKSVNTTATGKQRIHIENPKIVNGCQTVSTIYEVLKDYESVYGETKAFENTFVMVKFLDMNPDVVKEAAELTKNIVKRNNSQNGIDIAIFDFRTKELQRFQNSLEQKGFWLEIKQSDKNTFINKCRDAKYFNKIKENANPFLSKFDITLKNPNDYRIDLIKFLQVVACFKYGGHFAYTKKSSLKKKTKHAEIISYMQESGGIEKWLNIYLLFYKCEIMKKSASKNSGKEVDDRIPISFYVIDLVSKYNCDRNTDNILEVLKDKDSILHLLKKYSLVTKLYLNKYIKQKGSDYTNMIKSEIDYQLMRDLIDQVELILESPKYI